MSRIAVAASRARRAALGALAAAAIALASAGAAGACPVCWGDADTPLAAAMNSGVYVLLGVTMVVLAAFATFILTLRSRARRWEARKRALHVVSLGGDTGMTRTT
jgi:hypothetical protein